jgi:hypothetical protein
MLTDLNDTHIIQIKIKQKQKMHKKREKKTHTHSHCRNSFAIQEKNRRKM